ncbi:MAG: SigE family RNA polymerase sigma factor [Burkholderiaceae bacterium]|nr:SigE family RNA polymerase sigma factor [Microbacteriaceae bacterium]
MAQTPGDWEGVVTTLVEQRGPSLQRYAWLLCGDRDDAADLVQDALVKVFGRLGNGFSAGGAEAYVRRTILTLFLDRTRRRRLWHRVAHLHVTPEAVDSATPASEARIDLAASLARLAPRERACLVLRYYEDLKIDDIATELGISSGAVKRYVSDGLARLAVVIGPAGTPPATQTTTPPLTGGQRAHRS